MADAAGRGSEPDESSAESTDGAPDRSFAIFCCQRSRCASGKHFQSYVCFADRQKPESPHNYEHRLEEYRAKGGIVMEPIIRQWNARTSFGGSQDGSSRWLFLSI